MNRMRNSNATVVEQMMNGRGEDPQRSKDLEWGAILVLRYIDARLATRSAPVLNVQHVG
jgi:hypothetical protein